MPRPVHRQIANHEALELETAEAYRPYDRLIIRDAKGKRTWTVLLCESTDCGWTITAIRCPSGCQIHRTKR